MRIALAIVSTVFTTVFGFAIIGEKEKEKEPYMKGFVVSLIAMVILSIL